jgi:Fanconi anemia group M protein
MHAETAGPLAETLAPNPPDAPTAPDVVHPFVRPGALESRAYQLASADQAVAGSLLVVLPTGLGKTAIAVIAAAELLRQDPRGQILVLAPTRPLVQQHAAYFRATLAVVAEDIVALTGSDDLTERPARFDAARVIVSTPQGLANDLAAGKLDLSRVALMVVDEAHRTVGEYAYVPLVEAYRDASPAPRVLGLTASPGGDPARVTRVLDRLGATRVAARTRHDADVAPYLPAMQVDVVRVALPSDMQARRDELQALLRERLKKIARFLPPAPVERVGKTAVLAAGDAIRRAMTGHGARKGYLFGSLLHQGVSVQALHVLELLETQGYAPVRDYLARLFAEEKRSRAHASFLKDERVQRLFAAASAASTSHPKEGELVRIVRARLAEETGSRILVFAQYRDTLQSLHGALTAAGIETALFIGQANRGAQAGLTQAQQADVLSRFTRGDFPVLLATSVAEEGLHIPTVDLVVFYEPVPSEIRSIQRRGRTGRDAAGRVIVLVTEGTRDEAYLHAGAAKERRMRRVVDELARGLS